MLRESMKKDNTRLQRQIALKKCHYCKVLCYLLITIPVAIITLIALVELFSGDVINVKFEHERPTLQFDPYSLGYMGGVGFKVKLNDSVGTFSAYLQEITIDDFKQRKELKLSKCNSTHAQEISENLMCLDELSKPLTKNQTIRIEFNPCTQTIDEIFKGTSRCMKAEQIDEFLKKNDMLIWQQFNNLELQDGQFKVENYSTHLQKLNLAPYPGLITYEFNQIIDPQKVITDQTRIQKLITTFFGKKESKNNYNNETTAKNFLNYNKQGHLKVFQYLYQPINPLFIFQVGLNQVTNYKVVEPPDYIAWIVQLTSLCVFLYLPTYLVVSYLESVVAQRYEIKSLYLQSITKKDFFFLHQRQRDGQQTLKDLKSPIKKEENYPFLTKCVFQLFQKKQKIQDTMIGIFCKRTRYHKALRIEKDPVSIIKKIRKFKVYLETALMPHQNTILNLASRFSHDSHLLYSDQESDQMDELTSTNTMISLISIGRLSKKLKKYQGKFTQLDQKLIYRAFGKKIKVNSLNYPDSQISSPQHQSNQSFRSFGNSQLGLEELRLSELNEHTIDEDFAARDLLANTEKDSQITHLENNVVQTPQKQPFAHKDAQRQSQQTQQYTQKMAQNDISKKVLEEQLKTFSNLKSANSRNRSKGGNSPSLVITPVTQMPPKPIEEEVKYHTSNDQLEEMHPSALPKQFLNKPSPRTDESMHDLEALMNKTFTYQPAGDLKKEDMTQRQTKLVELALIGDLENALRQSSESSDSVMHVSNIREKSLTANESQQSWLKRADNKKKKKQVKGQKKESGTKKNKDQY